MFTNHYNQQKTLHTATTVQFYDTATMFTNKLTATQSTKIAIPVYFRVINSWLWWIDTINTKPFSAS